MWYYNNKAVASIEELPCWELLLGFAYKITNTTNGKFYIGRKAFVSVKKKNLTKKEITSDKRLKTYKHVTTQSNWQNYWGSNELLIADIKTLGKDKFHREIIGLAYSKKELTYLEIEEQCKHNVLRSDNCYNDNIMGKVFRKDLQQKCLNETTNRTL